LLKDREKGETAYAERLVKLEKGTRLYDEIKIQEAEAENVLQSYERNFIKRTAKRMC
jgi:hypothetical protein